MAKKICIMFLFLFLGFAFNGVLVEAAAIKCSPRYDPYINSSAFAQQISGTGWWPAFLGGGIINITLTDPNRSQHKFADAASSGGAWTIWFFPHELSSNPIGDWKIFAFQEMALGGPRFCNDAFTVISLDFLHGNVTDGHNNPLSKVRVAVNWRGQEFVDYTGDSGIYIFPQVNSSDIGSGEQGFLNVTLQDEGDGVFPFIRIMRDTPPSGVVQVGTTNFTLASKSDLRQDIDFSPVNSKIISSNVEKINLDHYATVYFHTMQAVNFVTESAGLNLTLDWAIPVDVRLFSTEFTSYDSFNSEIFINNLDTSFASLDKPDNREWHEFGHHVLVDSFIGGDNKELPNLVSDPVCPTCENRPHGSYNNTISNDSWIEGWTFFFVLLIKDANDFPNSNRLRWGGGDPVHDFTDDIEFNWHVMNSTPQSLAIDEEFAIAGILLDLVDPTNPLDNDNVDLTVKQVWGVLNDPNTPMGNIKEIYNAFANSNIMGINDLNQIFISHNVYNDTNENGMYDAGEPVGITSWPTFGKMRPRIINRPNKPLRSGSFLLLNVVDDAGQQINNVTFSVNRTDGGKYDFEVFNLSEKVYFYMPPFDTQANITARKIGFLESDPLIINTSFYWESVTAGNEFLLNHTFRLTPDTDHDGIPNEIDPTPDHDVAITTMSAWGGAARATLSDGLSGAKRVTVQVKNLRNHTDNVSVSLNLTGVPSGCTVFGSVPMIQLIAPFDKVKYLFFVQFECHSPAALGSYPLNVTAIAVHLIQPGDGIETLAQQTNNIVIDTALLKVV